MGCVNDNYKFDKIDVTLGFDGDQLTLPTNNSIAEIQLDDLLNIENSDIVDVAENGDYMFGKDPEAFAPVSVIIAPFKLVEATEYDSSFDIAVPAVLKPYAGWVQDVSRMEIEASGRIGVRFLKWDSVTHYIKIKRPAHLSIVERLGGFWW